MPPRHSCQRPRCTDRKEVQRTSGRVMHQRYSKVATKLHRVACAVNHETLLQRNALLQTCYNQMSKQPTGDALILTIRPHCIKNRDRASPGASLAEIGVAAEALPPGPAAGAGDPALGAASVCASVDPAPPVCTYHPSTRPVGNAARQASLSGSW